MSQYLAIVIYRCLISGERVGSLDIQVRWYEAIDKDAVRSMIFEHPIDSSYLNSDGETVTWELSEIMSVEPFAPNDSGDEVAGFTASTRELRELA